jgi:hypothetical protein
MNTSKEFLLTIVSVGIGHRKVCSIPKAVDWQEVFRLAQVQGVAAIVLDGLNKVHDSGFLDESSDKVELMVQDSMPQMLRLEWIGEVLQYEQRYAVYEKNIRDLATFYQKHGIRMMVLKGFGLSMNYPVPNHRPCGDLDIYLFGEQEKADKLIEEELGIKIDNSHHHHSVFQFQGETVENHYDFLNVHVRKSNKRMEAKLKELCHTETTESTDIVLTTNNPNETIIVFPSVEFNAIYLLRHCAAHFASTEMTVRQVLDWAFFMEKHHREIKWDEYIPYIKQEGMYRFYNLLGLFCMSHLGFDASIFHGLYSDGLIERFSNEILEPEFKDRENGRLLHSLSVKPRRWWHNRWKNRLCYPDSAWEEFVYGLWAKVLKPSHFWQ